MPRSCLGNKGAIVVKGPARAQRERAGLWRVPGGTVEVLAIKSAALELWESPSALGDVSSRLSCYITMFY